MAGEAGWQDHYARQLRTAAFSRRYRMLQLTANVKQNKVTAQYAERTTPPAVINQRIDLTGRNQLNVKGQLDEKLEPGHNIDALRQIGARCRVWAAPPKGCETARQSAGAASCWRI